MDELMEPVEMVGKVKWFSKDRGYGFIESGGREYFVHHNDIEGTGFKLLHEKQRVRFLGEIGGKGAVARCVMPSKT